MVSDQELFMRVKYRNDIVKSVINIVRYGSDIDSESVSIPQEDADFFVGYLTKVVNGFNEGNSVLYRLSHKEIADYKEAVLMNPKEEKSFKV